MKYKIVEDSRREDAKRVLSALTEEPHVVDLMAGKTIEVDDEEFKRSGSLYRLARENGKSLRVRSVKGGKVLWMEPKGAEAASTGIGTPVE